VIVVLFLILALAPPSVEKYFLTTENEVVPNFSKLVNTSLLRASVAVSIPTSDVIPTAMIRMVSRDLRPLLLIDFIATLKFSLTRGDIRKSLFTPITSINYCVKVGKYRRLS
jgi:hypothetical protein